MDKKDISLNLKIDVDTSEIDEAIKKLSRLKELYEEIKDEKVDLALKG